MSKKQPYRLTFKKKIACLHKLKEIKTNRAKIYGENESFTNLSKTAKSTINTSKYSGEYSIPNLSVHKIDL